MFPLDDAAINDGGGGGTGPGRDAGKDSGGPDRDAGRDAGRDSGQDAGRDAMVDGGRDAAANRAPEATGASLTTDEDTAHDAQLSASDEDGDPLTYEIVDAPDHGVLTLDEDSGDITYTPAANYHGSDAFSFRVNDGVTNSAAATVQIEVLAVNDAPVATGASLTVAEDTALALTLIASDVDGDTLTYTIVDDVEHGLLSGAQAARIYTPEDDFNGGDALSFRVSDGTAMSATVTVTIEVTPVNDAPDLVADSIDVDEGAIATTLTAGGTNLLANDSDREGGALKLIVTPQTAPAHGTLTLNAAGTFSYEHDGSETTSDSFVYQACDADATPGCSTATVTITVRPVDDAPTAVPDALTLAEGGTATQLTGGATSVLANDSDAEGEALTANVEIDVSHGTLTFNADGTFSYTHDGSENLSDGFVYRVCAGAPSLCSSATVMITVTGVNEAPDASDDAIALNEGATATILSTPAGATSLTSNDTDPDGDTLIVNTTAVTAPQHGTLTLDANGTFSYEHDGSETTSDSFEYQACDGAAVPLCDTATVTITITITNDAPIAVDDAFTVAEGAAAAGTPNLLANDTDEENDTLAVNTTPVADPEHGTLALNADGTFSYTHGGDEAASDGFDYEVCDANGCDTGHVTITVTPVNDTPVAVADSITVDEGGTATTLTAGGTDLRANDLDADGDSLTVGAVVSAPIHGTLVLNADGTFSYTHDGSETTSDGFVYEVCDPSAACSSAAVAITVVPVNEQPVAVADSLTVDEGATATTLAGGVTNLLANDSDPDGNTLTATIETPPAHGSLTIDADGTFSYTHDGSELASDSFQYEACDDGVPSLCAIATVTVTVTLLNDPPLAGAETVTVAEGGTVTALDGGATSVLANDSDAEGGTLSVSITGNPAHAAGFAFNADGTFSYTHDGSEGASDSFEYTVCDDAAIPACTPRTVAITVTPVNDAPTATDDVITVAEGATATVLSTPAAGDNVTDNDIDADGDTLAVTLNGPTTTNGTLTLNGDGTFSYVHDGSETTTDSFGYRICDPSAACATATVTIVVTPVNDAPVAADHAIALDEGGTTTVLVGGGTDLRAGATDVENDALSVDTSVATVPVNGSVTLNADGTFSYTHDGSETTSDGFDFRVCDASDCDVGHVTITVAPVNDAPAAVTETIAVAEGGTATVLVGGETNLLANDTDAENQPLTITTTPVVDAQNGDITINADGTFSYTHDGSETTSDSFSYQVCDTTPACSTVAVTIVVAAVNEQPVAVNDAISLNEGATATALVGGAASVIANDSDPDADTLSVTLETGPTQAALFTLNADGTFTYQHNGAEPVADSFVYELCDDDIMPLCTTATVDITIAPVNDAPTAAADAFTVLEAGTATTLAGGVTSVLANDTDPDSVNLVVTVATAPAHASAFTLDPSGTFSYTHDGSEGPSDSFVYEVCDDATPTAGCSQGTVTITVTQVNDGPVASDDAITVAEGGTATVLASTATSVAANDVDPEGDTLTVTLSGPTTTQGTLTLNADGTFSYVHGGDEPAADGFDYEVCDPSNACDLGHVTITVTPVNDPPSIAADSFTLNEGATATALTGGATSVLANDSDAEGGLTVDSVITPPAQASSFTLNPSGTFSYTHNGGASTSDSFVYRACDSGSACGNATVTITITPVNDAPAGVADSITVNEGATATALDGGNTSVLTNDTDEESATLTATQLLGPARASSFTLNSDGTFSYTHDGSENFSDSFSYVACEQANPTVCSASTTVTITITPVDDPPVAVADALSVNEGATATTLTGGATSVLANDTDAENNTLIVSSTPVAPTHGNLTINPNGTFSYTHDGSESFSDSFSYVACEQASPTVCSAAVTVAITIIPQNDPPVGGSYSYGNVVGNTLYTVSATGSTDSALRLGANDTDPDPGSVLSVSSIDATSAQGGTVTSLANGGFTYLPPTGYLGPDTFHYRISDNGTPTGTTDVTVNLTVIGPMIWYVSPTGAGTGRSTDPFSLASADAAATPVADTRIHVRAGTYGTAVSLASGQTLHGEGVIFAPTTTAVIVGGTRPLISTAASAVTMAGSNTVQGIDLTTTGGGTFALGGTITGFGVLSTVKLTAANGTALALSGSGSLGITNVGTITGQSGIVKSGSGSLVAVGAGINVNATGGPALDITGGGIDLTFGTVTSSNSASHGIRFSGVSSSANALTVTTTTVTNPATDGIVITGALGTPTFSLGTCAVSQAGTTSPGASGDAYAFTSNSAGTSINITSFSNPVTQNGRALFMNNAGNVTIGAVPALINSINAPVIDLRGTSNANVAGTGRWQFNALTATTPAGEGVRIDSLSDDVEVLGTTTLVNPLSPGGVRVDNNSNDITFADVTISQRLGPGIIIDNADNALISFGAVTISNAFGAVAPAIQIQNSNAAVSMVSTTITSATTGIRLLNNQGGSFTLNSAGGALNEGGTISQSSASAVLIDNCEDVSFDDLTISNPSSQGEHGIDANNVDGFVLRRSTIDRLGNANAEHGLSLSEVTGSVLIDDVFITRMADHGIELVNATGTANVRILSPEISRNDTNTHCAGGPCDSSGIVVTANGTSNINLLVEGGLFEFLDIEGVLLAVNDSATVNATIRNNVFQNGLSSDSAVDIVQTGGTLRFDIANNTVTQWSGHVLFAAANLLSGSATVDGTIRNNTLSPNPLFGNFGVGVLADITAGATYSGRIDVRNNQINNPNGRGVSGIIRGNAVGQKLNLRVTGNTVNQTGTLQGYFLQSQLGSNMCLKLGDSTGGSVVADRNNAIATAGVNYQVSRTGTGVTELEGSVSGDAAVLNGNVAPSTRTIGLVTLVPANTCPVPTMPIVP